MNIAVRKGDLGVGFINIQKGKLSRVNFECSLKSKAVYNYF